MTRASGPVATLALMKKIVLTFGVLSGLVSAGLMLTFIPLLVKGTIDFENGYLLGYSAIVLSFVLVFFGIRAYREEAGGAISFGRAFQVGILITLISCAFYVAAWETYYYGFDPDFEGKYTAYELGKARARGASDAEIVKMQQEMADFWRLYRRNPLVNIGMTFMEPFPVGLIVSLVSAAILRRKPGFAEPVRAGA